jgi:DNA polymerase-3 subunit epsilon
MQKFIYYDTETTGIKPGKDRLVEIAAYDPLENRKFCTFVNPECPIPLEATAITHITDEMVKDAPKVQEALQSFVDFCSGDVVLVAHNNDAFDKPFLEGEFKRAGMTMPVWVFVDSLKWARKYRNDLPRHNLQSLREVYGIEANQAHRALDDVIVLEKLFRMMIDDLSCEKVISLLQEVKPIVRMPFGKYSGKLIGEVPKDYVAWLLKNEVFDKPENALLKETFAKSYPQIFGAVSV